MQNEESRKAKERRARSQSSQMEGLSDKIEKGLQMPTITIKLDRLIVGKRQDPWIQDPGPFSAKIRKF